MSIWPPKTITQHFENFRKKLQGLPQKWRRIGTLLECLLVGGWATPLKNMSSSIGMIIPNIWKNKKCSKPPTSLSFIHLFFVAPQQRGTCDDFKVRSGFILSAARWLSHPRPEKQRVFCSRGIQLSSRIRWWKSWKMARGKRGKKRRINSPCFPLEWGSLTKKWG